MQTANQSLASLYMKRLITLETALTRVVEQGRAAGHDQPRRRRRRRRRPRPHGRAGAAAGARTLGQLELRTQKFERHEVETQRPRQNDRDRSHADICIFGTDARRADGQRRARRPTRWTPRSRRCGASRSWSRGSRRPRPRRRPATKRRPARLGKKVAAKNLAVFTRQFSVMIDAGLPLVQCLDILGSAGRGQELRRRHPADADRRRVGRVAGRRDAQAPEDVRSAVHQHDRRRRGGRHPRHDSQAAGDLHREGRQAARAR